MSEIGVFAVHRGVFDHPVFAPEPFTEREAWLWLVSAAAWKAKRVRIGRTVMALERGQLAFATRFMASKWQWSHSKVVRFLKRLEIDSMVSTQATRDATLITICNYEKYAFGRNTNETPNETQNGTLAERQRNKEEEGKKDNKKKDIGADAFEDFWKDYPTRLGANPKEPARKLFLQAVKGGADPQDIINGARQCAKAESKNIGTPYIPQAVKWLRDKRWEDYPLQSASTSANTKTNGVLVKNGTEAWDAWQKHLKATTGKGSPCSSRDDGWWFTTEYPPGYEPRKSSPVEGNYIPPPQVRSMN